MMAFHCLPGMRLFTCLLADMTYLRRGLVTLLLLGLLTPFGLAQQSQKPPPPPPPLPRTQQPPPKTGSVFERLEGARERQERRDARIKQRRTRLANAERRRSVKQLRQDLPRLRQLVSELQQELRQTDARNVLSVGLRKKGDELGKLTKRVCKNIRKL